MRLVTSSEMRQIEAAADAAGLSYVRMMQNAGRSVAGSVAELLESAGDGGSTGAALGTVVVLVGPGNNGGDGLVAAADLAEAGFDVRVLLWQRRTEGDPLVAAVAALPTVPMVRAESPDGVAQLETWLAEADVVADALLGTGASRPIEGLLAEILDAVASAAAAPDGPVIVAVDLPTGLHADDGSVDPHTVPADVTVTFGFPKVGQLRFPGASTVGELTIDGIGIPEALGTGRDPRSWAPPHLAMSTAAEVAACLPARPLDAHKGSFGRVLVIAGSIHYTGAAYLAAAAAYRSGTGLVTLALPASLQPIIASLLPEATFLPLAEDRGVLARAAADEVRAVWAGYDAVLLGPGLTTRPSVAAFVAELLGQSDLRWHPAMGEIPWPRRLVVDADGLNLVAGLGGGPAGLPPGSVLTPHPGEMARLTGRSSAEINADREGVAREAAATWGQIVVLKGAFTVIAAPDGRMVINPFASPALATAGTGDILAGLIAGLLAQGMDAFEAAVAAAHVHGLAGRLAEEAIGRRGVLAGDVLGRVAEAFRGVEA
jgi:hydroxyethylthiazole kinase-like uncharacterized protein yjeF